MKDQHQKITGYRDLPQAEIDLMNEIAAAGGLLRDLVTKVQHYCIEREKGPLPDDFPNGSVVTAPLRWAAIGMTDLQQGLMALTRAVAAPTKF